MSTAPQDLADLRFMDAALARGFAALGKTAPNPAVGCIIVRQGRVVGAAATDPGGRPHGEALALEQAGKAARGATAYVTLEPCAHHGQTPPCADALVEAGIARVVIGCGDRFDQVDGRGIARLQAAGVEVVQDVRLDAASAHHAGFFARLATGRPLVVQDGRPDLFDADLVPGPDESLEDALDRLGREGMNRVRLACPGETQR